MAKTVDVKQLLEEMRAKAQRGMDSGIWFSPIEENIGVELFGTITRFLVYKYDNDNRLAVEIRLLADTTFTVARNGRREKVYVAAGHSVLLGLTGQLRFVFEKHNVTPETTVYLRYEGKDMTRRVRGNHPHTWSYSFVNLDGALGANE